MANEWGSALGNTMGLIPPRDRTKATFTSKDYYAPGGGSDPTSTMSFGGEYMQEEAPPRNRSKTSEFFDNGIGEERYWGNEGPYARSQNERNPWPVGKEPYPGAKAGAEPSGDIGAWGSPLWNKLGFGSGYYRAPEDNTDYEAWLAQNRPPKASEEIYRLANIKRDKMRNRGY